LVASPIFARLAGLKRAVRKFATKVGLAHRALVVSTTTARHFAPATGSAHRAFAMARSFSRLSGVTGDRRLGRLDASLKSAYPDKKMGWRCGRLWADEIGLTTRARIIV
jgi:hypothetical protein